MAKRRGDRGGGEPTGSGGGTPRCPSWINEDAKAAWRQLVPLLKRMGVLARIDAGALTRYCQLWSRWKKAEVFIQQHGDTYPLKDETGKIKCLMQFPHVAIAHKLALTLNRLEQEFGMTPSARARLQVENPDRLVDRARSEKERFFFPGL